MSKKSRFIGQPLFETPCLQRERPDKLHALGGRQPVNVGIAVLAEMREPGDEARPVSGFLHAGPAYLASLGRVENPASQSWRVSPSIQHRHT
jgi:hypothetical protein